MNDFYRGLLCLTSLLLGNLTFSKIGQFCLLVFWDLLCSSRIPSSSLLTIPSSIMSMVSIFFFFCSNIYLTPSDLKVKFLDESRGDLNASIFSWSLVNVISSEPGLIFYWSIFFLSKNRLVVHSVLLQLSIGKNILCFCGPLKIFLLAKLTLE